MVSSSVSDHLDIYYRIAFPYGLTYNLSFKRLSFANKNTEWKGDVPC